VVLWLIVLFVALALYVPLRRLLRGPRRAGWGLRGEFGATYLRVAGRQLRRGGLPSIRRLLRGERIPVPRYLRRRFERQPLTIDPRFRSEWLRPKTGQQPKRTVLYFHGGGYVICSIATHRLLMARVAHHGQAQLLAVGYRLAPEHPFPAALDDALAAYRWLIGSGPQAAGAADQGPGVEPSQVVVAGDSAGGGLALALLVALRDAGEPLPAAAALLSPWVDLSARGGSFAGNARYDYLEGREPLFESIISAYVGQADGGARHPGISPGLAPLHGLPPLLFQVGEAEIFRDQVLACAERASKAGVEVALECYPDMVHAFQALPQFFPRQSRQALSSLGAFTIEHTAP
jgi:monoterpene epsilon-lactone hydrolase